MKIGPLIEALINISSRNKTDFALFMNMSPSGLSKILTGSRLPPQKEKKAFCKQATAYFCDEIWSEECFIKLKSIFPIIYNFASYEELSWFLMQALEYSLDVDYAAENNEDTDYLERGYSFCGEKSVLNMLCILFSNGIIDKQTLSVECYAALSKIYRSFPDIFDRLKLNSLNRIEDFSLDYYIDESYLTSSTSIIGLKTLDTLSKVQQVSNLSLWTSSWADESSFILIKGRCLLVFSLLIDGSPVMTVITNKLSLSYFYTSLINKDAKKITLTGEEFLSAIQDEQSFVYKTIDKGVNTVLSGIFTGYLLNSKDFKHMKLTANIKHEIIDLYHHILTSACSLKLTVNSILEFYRTGLLFIPMLGTVNIPSEDRLSYLSRFSEYIDHEQPDKVSVLNCDIPKMSIMQGDGYCILYLASYDLDSEKFHIFSTNAIQRGLKTELNSGQIKSLPFNDDLWKSYLKAFGTQHNSLPYYG